MKKILICLLLVCSTTINAGLMKGLTIHIYGETDSNVDSGLNLCYTFGYFSGLVCGPVNSRYFSNGHKTLKIKTSVALYRGIKVIYDASCLKFQKGIKILNSVDNSTLTVHATLKKDANQIDYHINNCSINW